jgi:predicted RNase H-like HicB family nuclease
VRYAVNYEQSETGWGASVPDLGVFAVAGTREEVRALVREAAEFHIACLREDGEHVPPPATTVDYVEVAA